MSPDPNNYFWVHLLGKFSYFEDHNSRFLENKKLEILNNSYENLEILQIFYHPNGRSPTRVSRTGDLPL